MKRIIVFLMGIFLLVGCSNVDSTNTGNNTAMSNYSTADLIVGTILATALYNNYGVSTVPGYGYGYGVGVGESKVKSHTNEVSNSHTTRSMGSDGSMNTRTVTHTTTKTKSKGMSYGIGF